MASVIRLSAAKQGWIVAEVLEVLGKRWTTTSAIVKRVRKRFEWATDVDVISALDQLWDEDRITSRAVVRKGVHGNEWRAA